MSTLPTIAVLSGSAEHADPWHFLPATSAAVAAALRDVGRTDVFDTAGPLWSSEPDLIVVNVAHDLARPQTDSRPVVDRILGAWERGAAVLGVHSASLAFPDDPRWAELLGGRWVRGVTSHPQIGRALVQIDEGITDLDDFLVYDERYSALEQRPGNRRVAFHTEDGVVHDLVWTRESEGAPGRAMYSALGHGVESYDSKEHVGMLRRGAEWLLEAW